MTQIAQNDQEQLAMDQVFADILQEQQQAHERRLVVLAQMQQTHLDRRRKLLVERDKLRQTNRSKQQ